MTEAILRYGDLLARIETRARAAQTQALRSANRQMLEMYWDIGRLIHERQQERAC